MFEDGRGAGRAVRAHGASGHSERLGGFVRDAVAEAGGGFEALDRIGVTVGPGSFTGLRVGLAFAQGLGAALDLPVVGVSTLDALARSAEAGAAAAALIDARRGQVYLQTFEDGATARRRPRPCRSRTPRRISRGGAGASSVRAPRWSVRARPTLIDQRRIPAAPRAP